MTFKPKLRLLVALLLGSGIATIAKAQSSVTLYGVVDGGVMYVSKTLNEKTGQNGGKQFSFTNGNLQSSTFGLLGTEDLGGGLHAIFNLESGIDISNGGFADSTGNLFGRQAWVGLEGGFGRVQVGVQYSPFVLSLIASDPRNISLFGSEVPIYTGQLFATGAYNPNAIGYTSPSFFGLQGRAMLALGGTAGNFQAGRQYAGSLTYANSGVLLTASYYDGNAGGSAATTPIPSTVPFIGRTIGAGYDWGSWGVRAVFVNYKLQGSFDNRVFGAGFNYNITPSLNVNAGGWFIRDGNDSNNRSIMAAAGVVYSLSKATALYGQYGFVNNKGAEHIGLSTNGALYAPAGSTNGVTLGIRHMF
ncbi:porin [Caballeronia zhejiangensis]|uniref:Porin n=1 Tax=Caballeronia zhejiangensis TaxID=871203 RepID=A0A656QCE3_9BURK|nr:porin [Caballeronia zhejiangensis]KAK43549.1 porin [Caballeronia jiangsuensis]KDR26096.1 porin [Caballeronia zhejiangensis]